MGLSSSEVWTDRKHRELKPHGTHLFPCAGYERMYTNMPGDVLPWHFHEEFEIASARQGSISFRLIGQEVHLEEGEMILINSNVLHMAVTESRCILNTIVFSPELIGSPDSIYAKQYLSPLMTCEQLPGCHFLKNTKETETFAKAFTALRDNREDYAFTVRECLEQILLSVLHENWDLLVQPGVENPDTRRLQEMLAYMEEHYPEEISLEDLSHATDIGKREVLRCFQRTIGESPMQYLVHYRLRAAADLLVEQPDLAVGEAARTCGFSSGSYFTRRFHELYQCTPLEYRKEHRKEEETKE